MVKLVSETFQLSVEAIQYCVINRLDVRGLICAVRVNVRLHFLSDDSSQFPRLLKICLQSLNMMPLQQFTIHDWLLFVF